MRLLEINSCCGCLSTGTIVAAIAKEYIQNGNEATVAYARSYKDTGIPTYKIGSKMDVFCHEVATFLFDKHGLASKRATNEFLKWAESYDPDLLWLHNIHGFYINYELLFEWIKTRPTMQVRWTLHDCWAFTGHCTYFSMVKCEKWRTICQNCQQKNDYPKSLFRDNSLENYKRKRKAFTGVKNMTIITPSYWLAKLVSNSFLSEYSIEVHYNTVDVAVFKPRKSNFKERYNLKNHIVILGVASTWSKRKGLDDFYKLANKLDSKYKVVLVGLDSHQLRKVPKNVLGLPRTSTNIELAEMYSAADMYINLSKEETFGLTTLEAILCGAKVLVYKDTACEEIARKYNAIIADQSIDCVYNCIKKYFEE